MISRRLLLLAAATGLAAGCAPAPPPAAVGGPFRLVDQDGRSVDETLLKGKWSAIYFGFTYCPDICPATLQILAEAKARLGSKGDKLQVILLSVDPERDTPALLKTYLDNPSFGQGTIGLTGTPEQVAAAAKAYKAYFKKVGEGDDYTVDHAPMVYLMDPQGRYSRIIAHGTSVEDTARIIGDAMDGKS